jgi:hypothetical protein
VIINFIFLTLTELLMQFCASVLLEIITCHLKSSSVKTEWPKR